MTPIPRHIRTAPRHAPWRPASAGLQTMPLGNGAPYPVARRDSGHPEALFRARDRQPAATGTPKFSNSGRVPPSTVHEHGFRLNFAVTCLSFLSLNVQVSFLCEQAPLQPLNLAPSCGVTDNEMLEPFVKL